MANVLKMGPAFHVGIIVPVGAAAPPQPERALVLAMLVQALIDLWATCRCRYRRGCAHATSRRDARWWVLSRDETYPFSFISLCRVLGLEPSAVRAACLRPRAGRERARVAGGQVPKPSAGYRRRSAA